LRGAIIGITFHIVCSIIILSITGLNPTDNRDLIAYGFPNVFLAIPLIVFIDISGIDKILSNIAGMAGILSVLTLYWFVAGGIVGWIYGKIKNRNISSSNI